MELRSIRTNADSVRNTTKKQKLSAGITKARSAPDALTATSGDIPRRRSWTAASRAARVGRPSTLRKAGIPDEPARRRKRWMSPYGPSYSWPQPPFTRLIPCALISVLAPPALPFAVRPTSATRDVPRAASPRAAAGRCTDEHRSRDSPMFSPTACYSR